MAGTLTACIDIRSCVFPALCRFHETATYGTIAGNNASDTKNPISQVGDEIGELAARMTRVRPLLEAADTDDIGLLDVAADREMLAVRRPGEIRDFMIG